MRMRLTASIVLLLMAIGCDRPQNFRDRLVTGSVLNRSNEAISRAADVKEITGMLQRMFTGIQNENLSDLNGMVHREKGIWIDLKAKKTAEAFSADLADPDGYVNTYYLDTEGLRRRTNDVDQKSLRDVIQESERIRADLFFQGDECEVRLTIEKPEAMESQSYRFNNAYFIKEEGRWYLYRLF